MLMTRRRALLWIALAALSFGPTITGAMPVFHGARYLPYTVAIFSICSFSFTQSKLLQRGATVILSVSLAVTVGDLIVRPFMPYILEPRPSARFGHPCPPQPHLRSEER